MLNACIRLFLGLPHVGIMHPDLLDQPCECGATDTDGDPCTLDRHAQHAMDCKHAKLLQRHDQVAVSLIKAAVHLRAGASVCNMLQMRKVDAHGRLLSEAARSKQQADVRVYALGSGAPDLLVDVTVPNPTAPTYAKKTIIRLGKPAATAAMKERAKVSKYGPLLEGCDSPMDFICPFGVEIYGSLGPEAKQVIQKLVEHAAHMGSPLPEHVGVGLKPGYFSTP